MLPGRMPHCIKGASDFEPPHRSPNVGKFSAAQIDGVVIT